MIRGALFLAALAPALILPPPAAACGGFACSSAAPVVQTAEQIVYVVGDDGTLTMSVRLAYTGGAAQFAWILPVPESPEITLGTEALFSALDAATTPTFSRTLRTDGTCRAHPRCEPTAGAPATDAAAARPDAALGYDAYLPDGSAPTVYAEAPVGPYETVVLGGGTADGTIAWLRSNGYDVPFGLSPLLESYVAAGQLFVALRLRNDATASDIQPITLGFGGVGPCLPIRLTVISTAAILPIEAFFLAPARATPRNYSLIETPFPPALYDGSLSYTSWTIAEARAAGGHGFLADFAGATPALELATLPAVADLATETDLAAFAGSLRARGYAGEPLTVSTLARFLEPPVTGTDPVGYTACVLGGVGDCGGPPASFDPRGAVAALDAAITTPRATARAWLDERPYLTRLSTAMTASDMTLDPEFVIDPGLDPVPHVHTAVEVTECDASTFLEDARVRLDVDDGRSIELRARRASPTDAEWCARIGSRLVADPSAGSAAGCAAAGTGGRATRAGAVLVALGIVARAARRRRAG